MSYSTNDTNNLLGQELSEAVILFHQAVAQNLGMSATEWKCLDILRKSGPIQAKKLANETGLTTGAITGIIDRLEKKNYVKRERNDSDRRSVIIQPIFRQDLLEKVIPIFSSLGQAMGELAKQFTQEELIAIQRFINGSIKILVQQRKAIKDKK